MNKLEYISQQTKIETKKIGSVLNLVNCGGTISFIVRYRQDEIGHLDEKKVEKIIEFNELFDKIEKRKESILSTLLEKGVENSTLIKQITNSYNLIEIEELYAPYKKKQKTKAQIAKEKGLEPLAKFIYFQNSNPNNLNEIYNKFIPSSIDISNEEAIDESLEIVKEMIVLNVKIKDIVRRYLNRFGLVSSNKKRGFKGDTSKFLDYIEYKEPVNRIVPHRVLAIFRGEKEGVLSKKIDFEFDDLFENVKRYFKLNINFIFYDKLSETLKKALKDSLVKSIEKEIFAELFEKAQEHSLELYSKNLESILLSPPAGEKNILAIDPGFKNGCKCASINKNGDVLSIFKFNLHSSQDAIKLVDKHINKDNIELIVIGDGTASKESLKLIKDNFSIPTTIVSEAGASIYSVSKQASKELSEFEIIYRGAISIARRAQDPLAELIKLDPKTLGIGQYQYDLNQTKLQKTLDNVVISCVNRVGADINTASVELLSYISGLTKTTAKNIIEYRKSVTKIKNRDEIKKIKGIGNKAFENCAGFLTIKDGDNILDSTNIHPENYNDIYKALDGNEFNWSNLKNLTHNNFDNLSKNKIDFILNEINKTKRDPRAIFEIVDYNYSLNNITDLKVGMSIKGKVKNITDFGAFVDIGIKTNGLLHKSKYNNFTPQIGSLIDVVIDNIDIERKRIGLKL